MRTIALISVLWLTMASVSYAQVINRQGTSGAPVSVSNSAVTVLPFSSGRKSWCLEPETVAVRCEPSNSSAAPSVTPTSSVGFYFPAGTITCHSNVPIMAQGDPAQYIRLDCISTGSATNVDTWEQ